MYSQRFYGIINSNFTFHRNKYSVIHILALRLTLTVPQKQFTFFFLSNFPHFSFLARKLRTQKLNECSISFNSFKWVIINQEQKGYGTHPSPEKNFLAVIELEQCYEYNAGWLEIAIIPLIGKKQTKKQNEISKKFNQKIDIWRYCLCEFIWVL